MINAWRKPRICTYSEHLQLSRGGIPAGVREVEDVLKQEGFGVLTEIDLRAALREKLGREFPPVKGARWFD